MAVQLTLSVVNSHGECQMTSSASDSISLVYTKPYETGDCVKLETDGGANFYVIQLEDSLMPALVYMTGTELSYPIPPENNRINHSPKSFTGSCHLIRARVAKQEEISARRNLAYNPYDTHEGKGFYPHAWANVETRGEMVFAACNAIDGIYENNSHGVWPYQSWGINRNPDAFMQVEFGRTVLLDEIRLTLRADFPHDSWWTSATVVFDDGNEETFALQKSATTQVFKIPLHRTKWIRLERLRKAFDESPFPALTQFEAWGVECLP